ncbi:D-cysteine desulfhydrase family pyridoxal phosphate-dependent enzyme [Inquilinus ginsengisoli]|uniref:D-cysteine desulfhydrase family pyridoxal phosphate-dependent enzyme n=1 Tax=Inquilinus ginsengisoli TaxID=363840 RepID=A0ABU1JPP7_9PROT|nr:D-cysteine desulfhydrase [Inquilinus ginsengisoli]MDR6290602.1 D-cysteine desulfhydrase family pyridoxal phosphate-dependent enzyme [Inquilinus ginsengisoli]
MPSLDQLPRIALQHAPTPLEPMPRLTAALGGPQLWIKRDDCTGLALGGNKVRKLEFLLGEALARGADTIITAGGPQSNHARQTAAAAAKLGLDCVLILTDAVAGRDPTYHTNGNLLLDELFGARIELHPGTADPDAELARAAEQCRAEGGTPYIIPIGGSNALGMMGYVDAARELLAQAKAQGVGITHVALASGSGGTHAGLALGLALGGSTAPAIGYCISRTSQEQRPRVAALLQAGSALLGVASPLSGDDVVLEDGVVGEGYGLPTDGMVEALRLAAAQEALLLDPVYTGKAMAGLIAGIRAGRFRPDDVVVFLHTGGAPSLFAYPDAFPIHWGE